MISASISRLRLALPLAATMIITVSVDVILGQVPFERFEVANNTDSQFTNVADIDGDRLPDVIAFADGFVSWYAYPGKQHHIVREDQFNPGRPAAADLDGDGDTDFLVAKTDHHVYWYENPMPTGDAAQGEWAEHHIGSTRETKKTDYIKDYGVADFDKDGRKDVVVATFDDPADLFFYFQDGSDRWYKKALRYENGHEGLDIGDIDGDGDPDVVTNGRWFETPTNARTGPHAEHPIDAKWHNQKGTWQRNATMIRVADIDRDGRLDVAVSHSELEGYPVSWYSAVDPKGRWEEHPIDSSYGWCQTLDLGDVDLDGDLDVLAGRFTRPQPPDVPPPHDIRVYYNPGGKSRPWTRQVVRSDGGIYFGHLVDLGSDGDLDVAGQRTYWTGPIEVFENKRK